MGLYYGRLRFFSGLHGALHVTRLTKEEKHDLSHAVFCHQDSCSLIHPMGGIDCKYAVYTPPQGEKAVNSGRGLDCKYAADWLLN